MTKNIVALATYRLPALQTRTMADMVGLYRGRLKWRSGHYSIAHEVAPSTEVAAAMDERISELRDGLNPVERDEAARMVTGLFLCYPSQRGMGEDEAKQITAMYVARLIRFPAWAVRKAFSDITSHVGRKDSAAGFAPSAEEIAAACRRHVLPFETELGDLLRIRGAAIEAPAQSPEQRAKMQAAFESLVKELAAGADPARSGPKLLSQMTREEAEANLERLKAEAKGANA